MINKDSIFTLIRKSRREALINHEQNICNYLKKASKNYNDLLADLEQYRKLKQSLGDLKLKYDIEQARVILYFPYINEYGAQIFYSEIAIIVRYMVENNEVEVLTNINKYLQKKQAIMNEYDRLWDEVANSDNTIKILELLNSLGFNTLDLGSVTTKNYNKDLLFITCN